MEPGSGVAVNLFGGRSPISPKALTWRQLKKLSPGTELVYFEWEPNRKSRVVLGEVLKRDPEKRFVLTSESGYTELEYASDYGLVPLGDGRSWHDSHVLVLPHHIDTLPTEPHWNSDSY
jgi:hypothetical protein